MLHAHWAPDPVPHSGQRAHHCFGPRPPPSVHPPVAAAFSLPGLFPLLPRGFLCQERCSPSEIPFRCDAVESPRSAIKKNQVATGPSRPGSCHPLTSSALPLACCLPASEPDPQGCSCSTILAHIVLLPGTGSPLSCVSGFAHVVTHNGMTVSHLFCYSVKKPSCPPPCHQHLAYSEH